jgi:hypothetical protein
MKRGPAGCFCSAPFASLCQNPTDEPNRCDLRQQTPKTPRQPLPLVGSTRDRPLWVVSFGACGFPLPNQSQFSRSLLLPLPMTIRVLGVKEPPTIPLVNRDPPPLGAMAGRDSATRRARRLAVQSGVGELWLTLRSVPNREVVPASINSLAPAVLWLACEVHFQARIPSMVLPAIPVRRTSRPWNFTESFVCSIPRTRSIVACRS